MILLCFILHSNSAQANHSGQVGGQVQGSASAVLFELTHTPVVLVGLPWSSAYIAHSVDCPY